MICRQGEQIKISAQCRGMNTRIPTGIPRKVFTKQFEFNYIYFSPYSPLSTPLFVSA